MNFLSSRRRRYRKLVSRLPVRSPIFLPTEKVPLDEAIDGLERVSALYAGGLDAVHRPRLRALRHQYVGTERCFVIGNGPSLNQTDLSLLANEVTFAVNGFFLKSHELGWQPTFYVVEDHLVAEDRGSEIASISGPTKLFPAYLGYCLPEDDNTVFFDHRPRVSYPTGFDFSIDAAWRTYTGCTVTFTCLQLAAYMGFREIYLVGVDADYVIPDDARHQDEYGTGVLDMQSEDPNHFDPSYFGRGFRWHDPQVDKMLDAYAEAKRVTTDLGQPISNAGVGGKLEVFPRTTLESLFAESTGKDEQAHTPDSQLPRLVIFDTTRAGDGSATGELKSTLLEHWPDDHLLHVYSGPGSSVRTGGGPLQKSEVLEQPSRDQLYSLIEMFDPECVIFRPVPENPALHQLAMTYLRAYPTPLATWIMDDWPERLRVEGSPRRSALDNDLRWLLERSNARLCISEPMAEAFAERYGCKFIPLANGVDPEDWPQTPRNRTAPFRVRYAGGLAANMGLASILRVAQAIESLAQRGEDILFEINTRQIWADEARSRFRRLKHTIITSHELSRQDYRKFLKSADALLIAYNFDAESKAYVGYSLANKLPECLLAGCPLLVHGPAGVATVDLVARELPEAVVSKPDQSDLEAWLTSVLTDEQEWDRRCQRGRLFGTEHFDIRRRQQQLKNLLKKAIQDGQAHPHIYSCRSEDGIELDPTTLLKTLHSEPSNTDQLHVLHISNQTDIPLLTSDANLRRADAVICDLTTVRGSGHLTQATILEHLGHSGYHLFASDWINGPQQERLWLRVGHLVDSTTSASTLLGIRAQPAGKVEISRRLRLIAPPAAQREPLLALMKRQIAGRTPQAVKGLYRWLRPRYQSFLGMMRT